MDVIHSDTGQEDERKVTTDEASKDSVCHQNQEAHDSCDNSARSIPEGSLRRGWPA